MYFEGKKEVKLKKLCTCRMVWGQQLEVGIYLLKGFRTSFASRALLGILANLSIQIEGKKASQISISFIPQINHSVD